jgi:hypothetical protein
MVCHHHFNKYYEKFRVKTLYPKLIGNCLSACRVHQHPKHIFTWMNQKYGTIKTRGMLTPDAIAQIPGARVTDYSSGVRTPDGLILFDAEWMSWCLEEIIDKSSLDHIDFREKFEEAIPIMKDETITLFTDYLSEINGPDFWKKCEAEFPSF